MFELSKELAQFERGACDRVLLNREPNVEGGIATVLESAEPLAQPTRSGEEINDWNGDLMAG